MRVSERPAESVWEYPRPPRVETDTRAIEVTFAGRIVAATDRALRVLETSHPPAFYLPREDCDGGALFEESSRSFCEYKGSARYVGLRVGRRESRDAGWFYPEPSPDYAMLADHIAFYPARVDGCTVGGVPVAAQEGDFYGGWITPEIRGPFKGGPGTRGW